MNEVIEYIKENRILIAVITLILGLGMCLMWNSNQIHNQTASAIKVDNQIKSNNVEKVNSPTHKTIEAPKNNELAVVDIQGAVKFPGVYRLKPNSIVQEAINLAGGLVDNADVKQINQAQKVTDQMQIFVPHVGEAGISGGTKKDQPVNINVATVDDFQNFSGIGPKKAEKIIEYRTQNGNFSTIEDLSKVSGIGDKTIESLRDQITV